jgi:hypothetical protein
MKRMCAAGVDLDGKAAVFLSDAEGLNELRLLLDSTPEYRINVDPIGDLGYAPISVLRICRSSEAASVVSSGDVLTVSGSRPERHRLAHEIHHFLESGAPTAGRRLHLQTHADHGLQGIQLVLAATPPRGTL